MAERLALRAQLLTLEDVRELLPMIGENTARELMHQAGGWKLGRHLVLHPDDLAAHLDSLRKKSGPADDHQLSRGPSNDPATNRSPGGTRREPITPRARTSER